MVAITQQQEERRQILYRYKNLLKSCKNIVSQEDIKLLKDELLKFLVVFLDKVKSSKSEELCSLSLNYFTLKK